MFIDKRTMMCYNKGTEQRKDNKTMENLKNNIKLIIIIIVIFSPLAILIFAAGQKNNQNIDL